LRELKDVTLDVMYDQDNVCWLYYNTSYKLSTSWLGCRCKKMSSVITKMIGMKQRLSM